jgi:hypothetical protein
VLEAMLDEEYAPEGLNLAWERYNSAYKGVIRPGKAVPAQPGRNITQEAAQPVYGSPAWPKSAGLGALRPGGDPGPLEMLAWADLADAAAQPGC